MKKLCYLLVFSFFLHPAFAQKKLIDKFFSPDTTRHNSFLPLPALGYTQEAGFIFGAAGLYSFYLDKKDLAIRTSQIYLVAYTSTKGQSQIGFKANLWSKNNSWHHLYDAVFYNQPFDFYGLGDHTILADKDRLKQKRYRLNAEVEKAVTKHYYPGLGVEFESLAFTDKEPGGIYDTDSKIFDKTGGKFTFLKITQLYDSRDNNTYPSKGIYARLKLGYAPEIFGSSNFTGTLFSGDFRYFKSAGKKIIFGSQFLFESVNSKNDIPFYMLRQMGNDELMRGYYQGRYRDKNYAALQTEMRYRFSERFGLVAFGGTGTVYGEKSFSAKNLKPNYGIGGRFFFDLEKNIAVRLDYGLGEKPPGEKRISGFYIALSEAF